jgi:hypothetical protein
MKSSVGIMLLGCSLLLSGCGDAAYWYQRQVMQIDCRPEVLQHGQCVPVQHGGNNAQTARP